MATTLHLEILTPAGRVVSEDVHEVVVPTTGGALGILPHHTPLATVAQLGVVDIRRQPGDVFDHVVISQGLVEVGQDQVVLLVDEAVPGNDPADLAAFEARAQAARQTHETHTEREIAATEAEAVKLGQR